MFCSIAVKRVEKRCSAFYHPQSNMSCNKSGCCRFRKVVAEIESCSTFCNEICTCSEFYRLKANLFAENDATRVWRDSCVILSNEKSVFTQLCLLPALRRLIKQKKNIYGNHFFKVKRQLLSHLFLELHLATKGKAAVHPVTLTQKAGHLWFPREMTFEKRARKFHNDNLPLPRSE